MSQENQQQLYDDLPYPNLCYRQTHPDRLATLATLLGMEPPPIDQCRVLELGSAVGGNLLPMAYALPNSTFVGIDFSRRQTEDAQAAADAMRLQNIRFKQMDILDVDAELGEFDYIIAHGVYSWVPPNVQDKVLEICSRNLAPQGVAYVSYNTYPGWHMLDMVRQMMLYHIRHITDEYEQAVKAQELVDFMVECVPDVDNHAYGAFLKLYRHLLNYQVEEAAERPVASMIHDELAEFNEPFYFHQFAARLSKYNLQYLAEARFSAIMPTNLPVDTFQRLQEMSSDLIEMEQYMDFLHNRTFRQTLLCHADLDVQRALNPASIQHFNIFSAAEPLPPKDPNIARFRSSDQAIFSTDHPLTTAAFHHLAEISPLSISFKTLIAEASNRLETPVTPQDAQTLAVNLLRAFSYSMQLIEFQVQDTAFVTHVSDHPIASAFARYQVRVGTSKVTNMRHERVDLEGLSYPLLVLLDGSRNRQVLVDEMVKLVKAGGLGPKQDDETPNTDAQIREMVAREVESSLNWLAKTGLLIG